MVKASAFEKALGPFPSVYLDTSVLIYHLEDRTPYSDLTQSLLQTIQSGKREGHTSVLSLLEINVKPYQQNKRQQALAHVALLKNFPHFFVHPIDLEVADRAAVLRAKYKLKTPDAIHVASALNADCEAFIGNDKIFRRVEEIKYFHLGNFI